MEASTKRDEDPQQAPSRFQKWGVICYQCGKSGHVSQECLLSQQKRWRPTGNSSGPKEQPEMNEAIEEMDCSFRHSKEIAVWDRPMLTPWIAGTAIQATLDTGCSQTLVRSGLVPKNIVDWCKPVRICCIHGEADQYERSYVDLRIANQKGKMSVGFAPKLDGQMIVGWDWPSCMKF